MLPDNPFYLLKTFGEQVRMLLTFNQKEKIKLHIELAEVRLAEAKRLQELNRTTLAQRALEGYERQMQIAENETERLKLRNITVDDIDAYMNQTTSKHIRVLVRVLANAPDAAKPGLQNALENAFENRERVYTRLMERIGANATSAEAGNITAANKTRNRQCEVASDCEGLVHIMVLGNWECEGGRCKWAIAEANESSALPINVSKNAGSAKGM